MIDIKNILLKHNEDIILEDLQYFETELATNFEYSPHYVDECLGLIEKLKNIKKSDRLHSISRTEIRNKREQYKDVEIDKVGLEKHSASVLPGDFIVNNSNMNLDELIQYDIKAIRDSKSYKTEFKAYVKNSKAIDLNYIEKNLSFFLPWEMDAMLTIMEFPEEFLEKYFDILNLKYVSRYQKFSETFFMNHFSKLDPATVLQKGKNEWKEREKRSKQLDVFLRLKGVKY